MSIKIESDTDDEFSAKSSSTDYAHLEPERIRRQQSFAWQYEDRTKVHQPEDLEG